MHGSLNPCPSKSLTDYLKFTGEVLYLVLGTVLPSVGYF